ncbi:hypothetical protein Vadar_030256 [Vaccinium darrowii]|uniref:Uncharacterized protein n=1 Tax=Vaccinium darrowii TaxID=229202 RepID=A0ACB7YSV5_9ERIC|nr:hypothetical protein Vadar_030256 [Vaccinium darrowii]
MWKWGVHVSHSRWNRMSCDQKTLRHLHSALRMSETETPFRPREKLLEKQKFYQSIHKHTYLKGPYDKLTSVAIPAALAASCLFLIGRGVYNMSHAAAGVEDNDSSVTAAAGVEVFNDSTIFVLPYSAQTKQSSEGDFNAITCRCTGNYIFHSSNHNTTFRSITFTQPPKSASLASACLSSVLSGYNGTVMAYGQTGTGKTYTLGRLGKDDASESGIMVRSMEDIIANTSASDSIEISYL